MEKLEQELILERINEMIQQRKWRSLGDIVADIPAPDLADLLVTLEKPNQVLLFTSLPCELASEVFSTLEPSEKDELLSELTDKETRRLLADLAPDERTSHYLRIYQVSPPSACSTCSALKTLNRPRCF